MTNFEFQNPTKIVFGKEAEVSVGRETAAVSRNVLLHYGGSSAERSGLLDRVRSSLKKAGVAFTELGGVKPNPRVSLVREGIKICREKGIDCVLAVGGGSVIDSAKAIGVGVPYSGDVWDFYEYRAVPERMLAVGVVLTIPAAGSESSPSSVISNEELLLKRGLTNEVLRPRFAIMNPELTFSLPAYQTACGAADIMAHVMERYFTNTRNVELTDRLCEATLRTIISNVPAALRDGSDYAARAEIMWAGTVAHNDLLGTGREGDWGSHSIEHEISAIYDVAHGAGLAVVFPAWMRFVYKHDVARFVQFAQRVWGVEPDYFNPERTALEGIARLEAFFVSIGLPTRLSAMNVGTDRIPEMAAKCTGKGRGTTGNFVKLDEKAVREILTLAK
jgi:alcohol dehydrogenase YqhD (iron-dependent ADH family)